MKKYYVTRERRVRIVLEDYGIMTIEQLKEFLTKFINYEDNEGGTKHGYVYANEKELDEDIQYIEKFGYESLIPWHSTENGTIEIREVK